MHLCFGIMTRIQTELRKRGHTQALNGFPTPDINKDRGLREAIMDLLLGHLVRDVKHLRTLTK